MLTPACVLRCPPWLVCTQALESFVGRVSLDAKAHLDPILQVALKHLKYDPNYAADEEEDDGNGMEEDDEDGADEEDEGCAASAPPLPAILPTMTQRGCAFRQAEEHNEVGVRGRVGVPAGRTRGTATTRT